MNEKLIWTCRAALLNTVNLATNRIAAGRAFWRSHVGRRNPTRQDLAEEAVRLDLFLRDLDVQKLPGHAKALSGVAKEIENCFMAISQGVEKVPDFSETLVRRSEHLLKLASGSESGASVFESTINLLEGPLCYIDRNHEQLQEFVSRLDEAVRQISKLLSSEEILNRAVAPLTFIRINFKIESASLPNSVQQMFLALTQDVERLHQQVSQTFGEKFAMLREVRSTIDKVANELKALARTQGKLLREKREAVKQALASLDAELRKNQDRDIKLTNVSRTINQEVGKLVLLIQTQDIVGQKLAHVEASLQDICEWRASWSTSEPGACDPRDIARSEASCRVQAAQLEGIDSEIRETSQRITDATGIIDRQIQELDKECLRLDEFDKVTAGVDGLVQVLLDTIDEVRSMTLNAVHAAEETHRVLEPIGGLASNLTGVMHQLSAQIHLIALNAQVQAAHHSTGNGLEVLASLTALVSTDAEGISERVAEGVDSLTVELDQLVRALQELKDEGRNSQEVMDGSARAKEGELHAMRDETLNELMAVSDCVNQISNLMGAMSKENDLGSIVGDRIAQVRSVMVAASDRILGHLEESGHRFERSQFSEELSKRYSVASEHAIHRTVFGAPPSSDGKQEIPADITLFDLDSDAETAHEATSSTGIEGRAGNVLVIAAPSMPEDAANKKDPTLGDNVDLF